MIIYINRNTEPYLNMATEEFLLRTVTEPSVMLWRNEPAVIIGKNQNAGENVNFDFTENSITNYDIIKKKLSDSLLIEQ